MNDIQARNTLSQRKALPSEVRQPMRFEVENAARKEGIDKKVPRVWVAIEKDGSCYTYETDGDGKVLGMAHLRKGKEKASYPIGKILAEHFIGGGEKGNLLLQPVESEIVAEMILQGFEDSEHTITPIGTMVDPNTNRVFSVCQTRGKSIKKLSLSRQEKLDCSKAIMKRLAALHTDGLGCGGLNLDSVVFIGKEAKVKNPGRFYALK
ncbi:Uncharacterised protein [uncultured archaeon]|nr:Uncharacterised protein [uncultured archaeon]